MRQSWTLSMSLLLLLMINILAFVPTLTNAIEADGRLHDPVQPFDLNLGGSAWTVRNSNGTITAKATVPGNAHMDLLAANIIPDPYLALNDVVLRWVALENWTYSLTFDVPKDIMKKKSIKLWFEGLDTVAKITLNDKEIGFTNNMFIRYTYDVQGVLKPVGNKLVVAFTSADSYARKKKAEYPYPLPASDRTDANEITFIRNYIRKEQSSFGWDWAPAFIPQGIWLPVGLKARDDVYIDSITPIVKSVHGDLEEFVVETTVYMEVVQPSKLLVLLEIPELNIKKSQEYTVSTSTRLIEISSGSIHKPTLWWPHDYGKPHLYNMSLTVQNREGGVISSVQRRIGFRTVEIHREPAAKGETFEVVVNKIPVFMKGANWVPMESFENRVTIENMYWLLESTALAGMNTLRVWGGGIYPYDAFYNQCDELGIPLWHDFMFGCALYPRDEDFLSSVALETTQQLRRVMGHASIALWSGNNENEWALTWFEESRKNRDLYLVDYTELYINTIYPILEKFHDARPFWPSSPSNGPLVENPYVLKWGDANSPLEGDMHYYNFTARCADISTFHDVRFMSEFGWQGVSSYASLALVIPKEELFWNSTNIVSREHTGGLNHLHLMNTQLANYFPSQFDSPKDTTEKNMKRWIYSTQLTQALCITAQIEHYRRHRGQEAHTMGALYWMLNGIWQSPDWSSIEYGGSWKMLHHRASESFSPVAVSMIEPQENTFEVWLVTDEPKASQYEVKMSVHSLPDATLLRSSTLSIGKSLTLTSLRVHTSTLDELSPACRADKSRCFVRLEAWRVQDNVAKELVHESFFFVGDLRAVRLSSPGFAVREVSTESSHSVSFTLTSNALSLYTQFAMKSFAGRFSSNALHLLPTKSQRFTFVSRTPISVTQFKQDLEILSLAALQPGQSSSYNDAHRSSIAFEDLTNHEIRWLDA